MTITYYCVPVSSIVFDYFSSVIGSKITVDRILYV